MLWISKLPLGIRPRTFGKRTRLLGIRTRTLRISNLSLGDFEKPTIISSLVEIPRTPVSTLAGGSVDGSSPSPTTPGGPAPDPPEQPFPDIGSKSEGSEVRSVLGRRRRIGGIDGSAKVEAARGEAVDRSGSDRESAAGVRLSKERTGRRRRCFGFRCERPRSLIRHVRPGRPGEGSASPGCPVPVRLSKDCAVPRFELRRTRRPAYGGGRVVRLPKERALDKRVHRGEYGKRLTEGMKLLTLVCNPNLASGSGADLAGAARDRPTGCTLALVLLHTSVRSS